MQKKDKQKMPRFLKGQEEENSRLPRTGAVLPAS